MGQTNVTVPMVGKIVSILVKQGDAVSEDDEIAIFEAMKMEMPLVAPLAGKIAEIKVEEGQLIEAETVVAVIESEQYHMWDLPLGIAGTESRGAEDPGLPNVTGFQAENMATRWLGNQISSLQI